MIFFFDAREDFDILPNISTST